MDRLLTLLALIILSYSSTAKAADPVASASYRIDYDGLITVGAFVNGRGPYDFVIDTGATLSVAFQNLADREKFLPAGGAQKRVFGISGFSALDTYRIGEVSIGGAALPDHVGVIIQDWDAPRKSPAGIIGIDFLRKYAVVFDVEDQTMTLYPHGGIPKEKIAKWKTARLEARNFSSTPEALFAIRGQINRLQTTFVVDLGSGGTLINYRAAESIMTSIVRREGDEGFTTGSRLRDVFDDRARTRTALLSRVHVGRKTWRDVRVWVKDAPVFNELGVNDHPFGLLGADLLAAQDFALDFGEKRLYVSRSAR